METLLKKGDLRLEETSKKRHFSLENPPKKYGDFCTVIKKTKLILGVKILSSREYQWYDFRRNNHEKKYTQHCNYTNS